MHLVPSHDPPSLRSDETNSAKTKIVKYIHRLRDERIFSCSTVTNVIFFHVLLDVSHVNEDTFKAQTNFSSYLHNIHNAYRQINRFTEFAHQGKTLTPIAGYWRYPLVSLNEALKPFD